MTASMVETRNLTKRYQRARAVDDLTLHLASGEIYGFVGLNGAGKSTTIRMLLGMTRPSHGTAYLFGRKVSQAPWGRVGYLVEGAHSYPGMTVWENLELVRRLQGVPDRGAIDRALELLGLTAYRYRRAGVLSLGNAQRLALAKALLHRPDLLILDEPANGLDPAGIVELRDLLAGLAHDQGVAILVSSHILAEVARLAIRIGIIDHGRLLTEFEANALQGRRRIVVDTRDHDAAREVLRSGGFQVRDVNGLLEVGDRRAAEHPDDIASMLAAASVPPTLLQVQEEDLEALFLRLVTENQGAAS